MSILKACYKEVKEIYTNLIEKPMLQIVYFIGKGIGVWSKEPLYLVRIDGGISSQIDQYVIGLALFEEKGEKNEIVYDLTWYKECGMDLNSIHVRNFDLLKMFPDLKIQIATPVLRKIYYTCFRYDGEWRTYKSVDVSTLPPPPLYLDGYGYSVSSNRMRHIYRQETTLKLCAPQRVLDKNNYQVYLDIMKKKNSVAVQVRRGDMATAGFTSHPVSSEYYIEAMKNDIFKDAFFYFFSDEPEWVRSCVFPLLDTQTQYKLIDLNGSDKGYMDLFLCASCKHIISSQGSMGAKASILGGTQGSVLIMPDFRYDVRIAEAFPYLEIHTISTEEEV